jgi:hypothetical protein
MKRQEARARLVHRWRLRDLVRRRPDLGPYGSIASAALTIARELGRELARRHERAR